METILEIAKSYFALFIVLTIFTYLMPKESYKKYMQFFVGIFFIVMIIKPAAEWMFGENAPDINLSELEEQLNSIQYEEKEGTNLYEIYFEFSGEMEESQME